MLRVRPWATTTVEGIPRTEALSSTTTAFALALSLAVTTLALTLGHPSRRSDTGLPAFAHRMPLKATTTEVQAIFTAVIPIGGFRTTCPVVVGAKGRTRPTVGVEVAGGIKLMSLLLGLARWLSATRLSSARRAATRGAPTTTGTRGVRMDNNLVINPRWCWNVLLVSDFRITTQH